MTFKVYYLDDEEHLCAIFKEFITCENVDVLTFTDASEAILYCAEQAPDMIFLDYRLADTTGEAVAKQLDASIPKVLVTGELEMPKSDYFLGLINKPYKLAEIQKIMQQCLEACG